MCTSRDRLPFFSFFKTTKDKKRIRIRRSKKLSILYKMENELLKKKSSTKKEVIEN
jgi:hypothetical protein